jgi:hypothetical protein|nr:MAG TPA: hypothetical protein [Caudoviricetes sp.]
MQECFQPLPTQTLEFEVGDLVVLRNHKIAQVVYVSKYGRVFAVEDGPEVQDVYVYNSDGTRYTDSESETDIIAKMVMCNRKRVVLDEHKTEVPVTLVLPTTALRTLKPGSAVVTYCNKDGKVKVINLPAPFSPKHGEEEYYYIRYSELGDEGIMCTVYVDDFRIDKARNSIGNCFRTRKDATVWKELMKQLQEK